MRDKAHTDLVVTITTDPSETAIRALDHDAETAARVLLRTRLGRLTAPAQGAVRRPNLNNGLAVPKIRAGQKSQRPWWRQYFCKSIAPRPLGPPGALLVASAALIYFVAFARTGCKDRFKVMAQTHKVN